MPVSLSSKIVTIMAMGVLILVLVGVGGLVTLKRYDEASNARTVTFQVTTLLERLLSDLKIAESGQRGYLLTGDETNLAVYQAAVNTVDDTLREIKTTALDANVKAKLDLLDDPIDRKLEELAETLRLHSAGQQEESLGLVRSGKGQQLMSEIREIIEDIKHQEELLLRHRNEELSIAKTINITWLCGAILLAVVLKLMALYIIRKEIRQRKIAQQKAVDASEKSQAQLQLLNSYHETVSMLSRLTTLLHSCNSQEEAAAVIAQYSERIFAGTSGTIYTYNSSRDMVESVVTWGNDVKSSDHFSPEQCWGLRTGQDYDSSDSSGNLRCTHMEKEDVDYICLPMLAQGDAIGLFHIEGLNAMAGDDREYLVKVASTTADVIAPALVNLRLRETLKQQSIRDPLTGLYNRRFMEESFAREIGGAERRKSSVAAIMIDLDHFKKLNDTYGHDGGDAVLAAVGRTLMNNTRPEDICCRYGGEELAIILPGADSDEGARRAEDLRKHIEEIRLHVNGKEMLVTASFGVAVYPVHGKSADHVVKAADQALYRAKADGRNRVACAPGLHAGARNV